MTDTNTQELAKSFDPAAIEARWYPIWEERGYFKAGLDPKKPSFSIQLPPPNITGILHMGHAFNQTVMDTLTRYHRMAGYNTVWIPGTDHAGIATQIVVERKLEKQGIDYKSLTREQFIEKVWEWQKFSGGTILNQMRRIGDSVDWDRTYFTMDEKLSKVVIETFVRLYEEGLIYRGNRIINWCPECQTALSDAEVEYEEQASHLWHIRYPGADGGEGVVVATTDENGERIYQSNILSRSSMVHLLGDDEGNIANGVDSFQANYLLGFETSLTERVTAFLSGETRRGDNVTITADSRLCTEIVNIFRNTSNLKGKCGAVVVMNYRTGEVLALVSLPVYDPQNITDQVRNSSQHPFWNRALQGTLPPGSTFKIITAAAALENLPDAETHVFTCTGATQVMDHVVHDYNMDQHGDITLDKAFRVSCNNAFAQAALMMGDTALRRTAEAFGFNDNFLFRDLVVENSVYPTQNRNSVEIAWSGAGQSQVVATPMHMCMVAAAIANDGVMMEPRLLSLVESPTGKVRLRYSQKVYRTACSPEMAQIIDGYMKDVVKSGTGTRAQVSGLTIAGKTGSAEGSDNGMDVTHAWFVGYIDSDQYPYAISVLVENGGSGGSVAAPVARQVFEYLRDNLPS